MKTLFLLAALLCCNILSASILDQIEEKWHEFKITHDKQYSSETEENFRMKIFIENPRKVVKHNKLYDLGMVTFKLKINKWADMLHHEFIQLVNGYNRTITKEFSSEDRIMFMPPANVQAPLYVNWTEAGAVTPVKDQKHCGSCWSFSATGALEGQVFRKTGKLVSLSEQNLIDCSIKYGNHGCNGGLMDNAFRYIKDNKGLDTEASYPYEAVNDRCRYNPKNSGATDRGFVDILSGDEEQLQMAVATVGPISVAIDASHESFHLYSEGVYYEPECSKRKLDHAVLLVGYGIHSNRHLHYWLVKNSWGTSWGLHGYVKMARKRENNCGIASKASYPIV